MSNDKSTKILGVLALIGVGAYLYKTKNEPQNNKLEGLDINVDPELIVENIRSFIPDPKIQNFTVNATKKIVTKVLSPKVE